MALSPGLRKLVLTAHLTASIGWIGALIAYLALGLAAVTTSEPQTVRAAWIAMELTGWYVIVPLAIGALVTGLVISLGTAWGLFRHYWVVISLVLTLFSTIILVLHMPSVSSTVEFVKQADDATLIGGLGGDLFHPTLGFVILLAITALNVYKPRGLTPYGWRKQQEERTRVT